MLISTNRSSDIPCRSPSGGSSLYCFRYVENAVFKWSFFEKKMFLPFREKTRPHWAGSTDGKFFVLWSPIRVCLEELVKLFSHRVSSEFFQKKLKFWVFLELFFSRASQLAMRKWLIWLEVRQTKSMPVVSQSRWTLVSTSRLLSMPVEDFFPLIFWNLLLTATFSKMNVLHIHHRRTNFVLR